MCYVIALIFQGSLGGVWWVGGVKIAKCLYVGFAFQ